MSLPVMKIQQRAAMSSLLKKEIDPEFCRGTGTLLAGFDGARSLDFGALIGKIGGDAAPNVTVVVSDTNTGNGVLTLASPASTAAVKPGRYTVTFVGEVADAGNFKVEDPNGVSVGAGKVATAFGKHVRFNIADGSANFVIGDQFFIDVEAVDSADVGKIVAWDPTATDGRQVIHGVCLKGCEAPEGEDLVGGVLFSRRLSILAASAIAWPSGLDTDVKAAAVADMEDRLGLIVRS